MKPTKRQIKEFWEWCGFKCDDGDCANCKPDLHRCPPLYLKNKRSEVIDEAWCEPPDLNNLFKYAVPKLIDGIDVQFSKYKDTGWFVRLENQVMTTEDKDPALALFWVIYGVIKEVSHS